MTDFDPNWPHGHVLRHGNNFTIFERTDHGWFGKYEDHAGVERAAKWGNYCGGYLISATTSADEFDFALINAPAPKRTFKRWYVTVENMWEQIIEHTAPDYKTAKRMANSCADDPNVKSIISIYEREVIEGHGLDDSNLQKMHSAPEPEEPKTVHVDFWVNVYGESFHELAFHKTHDDAVLCQRNDGSLLQCIHIERDAKVGEGLDD